MRAIVGKSASATPMMAAQIRYASVNPYWNVPPISSRR
jgi:murein L,D-transpeptidase YcbB/YkuD